MKIHPETIAIALQNSGLNQAALAETAGVTVRTISRIINQKSGHQANRNANTIERIANALGITPKALCSPPEDDTETTLKKAGYRPFNTYIKGRTALQYSLINERYGVSSFALVAAAPLLLTLLAEMSLKDRRSRLAASKAALTALLEVAPQGIEEVSTGAYRLNEALEIEELSLNENDWNGGTFIETDRFEDPFLSYLGGLSVDLGTDAVKILDGEFAWLSYDILRNDLQRITNDDVWAEFALEHGHVRLGDIPSELKSDEKASDRAAWLAQHIPETVRSEEEARMHRIGSLLSDPSAAGLEGSA